MSNALKKKLAIIQEHQEEFRKEFNVKSIGIFGSYSRGSQSKKSDIDIVVEFSNPVGFFKFLELEDRLSKVLTQKVDLTTKKALKPIIKKSILKDVVYA
jgi:uncharacterized protein